ncbi:Signal recognition particle receptor subunit alpha [Galdieria sulphuraria]|uniref:Fused signal recognition particle receptor n=1 Tax=Galdieria sulphuraria TaxID=130081 RepID=M2XSB5_GALSU|nr:fused signal recognition particle receptor [Galdieria sulphuraria]EME26304.1 fused signal recognition particle receptor [Galdieria sulphuraria]GJD06493.1 Signal recognition particle receptor subunit alpha [Galdieria sulphuraria]|eukprot:XP_005702824.1 fused signal recognition particle receptor [Galdieria sulphuraria]
MIDLFVIFTRGGFVLFYDALIHTEGRPIDRLIRSVLLVDKAGLGQLSYGNFTVKWTLSNQHGLVFAVVFPRRLPISYANVLLEQTKDSFCKRFKELLQDEYQLLTTDFYQAFARDFQKILRNSEDGDLELPQPVEEEEKNRRGHKKEPQNTPIVQKQQAGDHHTKQEAKYQSHSETQTQNGTEEEDEQERIRRNIEKLKLKKMKKPESKRHDSLQTKKDETLSTSRGKKNTGKLSDKLSKQEAKALDYSLINSNQDEEESQVNQKIESLRSHFIPQVEEDEKSNSDSESFTEWEKEEEEFKGTNGTSLERKFSGTLLSRGVLSFFKGLTTKKELTKEDLEPVLNKFRDTLITKNVASDIAQRLCDSVGLTLQGNKLDTFGSVSRIIRNALEISVARMLTPRQSDDLVADIVNKRRETGKPFVIVFCGVNGVGKSTTLAKVCYYLQSNDLKVMIAACDTFRAGAVEQLRIHARCLNVELFEKGYAKDPSSVASDAIHYASEKNVDVLLVDTAGRMQDNEPLMKALAKLVNLNKPDRVFFVGEALVGNDAVDQLLKFNDALIDNQNTNKPREIDGIILTKFDSIDDKVGAAVSMVYSTNIPIVFVGVGQTYVDLKKMNISWFVKALLR